MSKKEAQNSQYRYALRAALLRAKRDHIKWSTRNTERLTICEMAMNGWGMLAIFIEYAPNEKRIMNIHFSCISEDGEEYMRYIKF